jgi:tRNA (cytidine/uridine-2'-O-)-methyltransferase
VAIKEIDDLPAYLDAQKAPPFFFSSKATRPYAEAPFTTNSLLIFGSETAGLPPLFWERWPDRFYTIPMRDETRCLNLASSAAIVLYEALRQTHFALLSCKAALHDQLR